MNFLRRRAWGGWRPTKAEDDFGAMRQIQLKARENKNELALRQGGPRFVPAGQSTQMIIGAAGESDYQILMTAEALYRQFAMKRVFFSAFVNVNMDSALPMVPRAPGLLREHRLYQADWLLRFYGFEAEELLSPGRPDFNVLLDPKCDWALRHLEQFPVEINGPTTIPCCGFPVSVSGRRERLSGPGGMAR